ncbi:hypothetical protein P5V15_004273 [Pogonomyrmex californicus]
MKETLLEFPVFIEETQSIITLFLTQEIINKVQTDQKLLQSLVNREISKQNNSTDFSSSLEISQPSSALSENVDSEENDCSTNTKGFVWSDAAVYLLLELYREKESDFNSGSKRNATIWAELAEKMRENFNGKYAVTGLQCSVKMSGLKRTFKNISDQNKKSGNCRNTWIFYSMMDSIFGKKAFVMPPAIASSEGPVKPTNVTESPSLPSNPSKKRRVETVLKNFIDDIRQDRNTAMAKREEERKEYEKLKAQRYIERKEEQRKIHEEKMEIQKSLIEIMKLLIEKQK